MTMPFYSAAMTAIYVLGVLGVARFILNYFWGRD